MTEWLTINEVSKILNLHRNTVEKLCRSGKLGKKFGKSWRIPRSAIESIGQREIGTV